MSEHEVHVGRFTGCLLGLALGDAIGAPFEGSHLGEKDLSGLPGKLRYTDDTQMAMGVSESLVESGGFDADDMARRFSENFDPSRGYGSGAVAVLGLIRRGVPWQEANKAVFPGGSYGNGAAMRAAPIGLFFHRDEEPLVEATLGASAITHDHTLGKDGALVITHTVSGILKNWDDKEILGALVNLVDTEEYRAKLHLVRELLAKTPSHDEVVARLGNNILALNSAPTALYAYMREGGDYMGTIAFCLSLGGDTDTIAAMAGALTGTRLGAEALPAKYLERLEDRKLIEDLAVRLYGAAF